MSTPLRVHRGQRANERHNLRVQLVAAMVTGCGEDTADTAKMLEAADAIIDALEAALAREKA